ncbi:hypothetical protein [Commensalibacter nepenthis]|uniref:Uncharacterized protein n=1 Tax=Commensalibacter nepenthis TaxID=3043872 RepID=A0ABT6Q4W9_9PROT|nr:hypothetical protein [Commensalibacter sp. TBRC 10068]MDI2111940.1 hypothetical protein [Commensalibacter sp. TBRC 10068]
MVKLFKPSLNFENLIACAERLESLLNEYKQEDVFLRTFYEILEPLFKQIYKKQLNVEIDAPLIDGIISCAGYQISDSGLDI